MFAQTSRWTRFLTSVTAAVLGVMLWAAASPTAAQTSAPLAGLPLADGWPNAKQIRIVVPFSAGGPTDIYARMAADVLAKKLNLSIVVENKPGAGGNIAAAEVAKSAPDGYTLLVGGPSTHAINQTLYAKPGFDSVADFEQIAIVAKAPSIATVHPTVPVQNWGDFIAWAKDQENETIYPMPGIGTTPHLAGELLRSKYGLPFKAIAYRGAAPALNDAIGGHVKFMLNNFDFVLPHVRAGTLRPLAVTSRERVPALPDVPTFAELGYPDVDVVVWHIMCAPKGTPREIVELLNKTVLAGMNEPVVVAQLAEQGVSVDQKSPSELAEFVKSERARWAGIVKLTGAKLD